MLICLTILCSVCKASDQGDEAASHIYIPYRNFSLIISYLLVVIYIFFRFSVFVTWIHVLTTFAVISLYFFHIIISSTNILGLVYRFFHTERTLLLLINIIGEKLFPPNIHSPFPPINRWIFLTPTWLVHPISRTKTSRFDSELGSEGPIPQTKQAVYKQILNTWD